MITKRRENKSYSVSSFTLPVPTMKAHQRSSRALSRSLMRRRNSFEYHFEL